MVRTALLGAALCGLALAWFGVGGACRKRQVVASFPDEFVGVGVELTMRDRTPVVARVIAGGAAEMAGVKVGDVLSAIDGVPVVGKTLGDVVVRIRQAPQRQVILQIVRGGSTMTVVVRRASMKKEHDQYRPVTR